MKWSPHGVSFRGRVLVAFLALVATYAFFYEYFPPFKKVHFFSDIEGYHYPLQRYAFEALKEGRIPQWDPSIYCGITFIGNVQAALLYPPSWLMFAASWGYRHIPFKMVEAFAIAHIWLGFLLCYLWLRGRRLAGLPSVFGAAVFAFGGYMVSQVTHLGVVTGLAWMPLGLWGIDEAVDRRDWRPLWKTAAASALSFLAGYPPSWLVFCATVVLYALASRLHWRAATGVCAALGASLLLAMVQLLPVLEARSFMLYGEKYGGGVNSWRDLIPYFVPNWFDFNLRSTSPYPGAFYLYLGVAATFALGRALFRFRLRDYGQPLLVGAICLIVATNPRFWVYDALSRIPALIRMVQSYNFYEGVAAMAALITAIGMHRFLERAPNKAAPRWLMPAMSAVLIAWAIWQLRLWRHGGTFPIGIGALAQTAAGLAVFSLAVWTLRSQLGWRRAMLAVVLLLAVAVDYKVFGTRRRFNTVLGDADEMEDPIGVHGMNHAVYRVLLANRHYRIAADEAGAPHPTDLRKWKLATPQGFDPFLPTQYHARIERWTKFRTNRLFYMDLRSDDMLQTLGVRYVISHEGVGNHSFLAASRKFRPVGPGDSYYRVYEYENAKPPYGWENGSGEARPTAWMPERRDFQVRSDRGGRFVFDEQFFPGWTATVDGRPVPIERWNGSFQAIQVAGGEHMVIFQYRSRYLYLGAAISLAALAGLAIVIVSSRRGVRCAANVG